MTLRGLQYHFFQNKKKDTYAFDYEAILSKSKLKNLIKLSKEKLAIDQCYQTFLSHF